VWIGMTIKQRAMFKSQYKLGVTLAIFGIAVTALAQHGKERLPVENRTASLSIDNTAIVSNQNGSPAVAFRLTNKSKKAVLAYKVSINGTDLIREFFAPERESILPGESDSNLLTPVDGIGIDLSSQTFYLKAAIFTDRSAEGDSASIEELKTLRKGRLLACRSMQPVLDELVKEIQSDSTHSNAADALSTTIERLKSLPPDDSDGKPMQGKLASGFQDAVGAVTSEMESIFDNHLPQASIFGAVTAIIRRQDDKSKSFEDFFRISGTTIH